MTGSSRLIPGWTQTQLLFLNILNFNSWGIKVNLRCKKYEQECFHSLICFPKKKKKKYVSSYWNCCLKNSKGDICIYTSILVFMVNLYSMEKLFFYCGILVIMSLILCFYPKIAMYRIRGENEVFRFCLKKKNSLMQYIGWSYSAF